MLRPQRISMNRNRSAAEKRSPRSQGPPPSWSAIRSNMPFRRASAASFTLGAARSEEHTSELQSRQYLVCRLLLEKKKKQTTREQNKRLYCYMQKGFDIVYRVTTTANSSTSHTPDTLTCVTHTPLTLYNCIRHSLS